MLNLHEETRIKSKLFYDVLFNEIPLKDINTMILLFWSYTNDRPESLVRGTSLRETRCAITAPDNELNYLTVGMEIWYPLNRSENNQNKNFTHSATLQ